MLALNAWRGSESSSVTGARVMRSCLYAAAGVFALVATIYLVRAFDSRGQLDLGPEHRVRFVAEFTADQESRTDWQGYRDIEALLAAELQSRVDSHHRGDWLLGRHLSTSLTHPDNLEANWNYSYVASPSTARGAAVMLHGLTDSPYSLLATASLFVDQGYHAVIPRMPGHGFAVGGLKQANWDDWAAVVRLAVRHAQTLIEPGQPLVLVGYSNGALLAVHYALRCGDESSLMPRQLGAALSGYRRGLVRTTGELAPWDFVVALFREVRVAGYFAGDRPIQIHVVSQTRGLADLRIVSTHSRSPS